MLFTKKRIIQYIEGLFSLYNKELNQLRFILNGIDIKDKENLKQRLITERLRQLLYDGDIAELLNCLGDARFRKYFSDNKKVKGSHVVIKYKSLSLYVIEVVCILPVG